MIKLFKHLSVVCAWTLLSCSLAHAESLSKAELDLLVKEDIATAQVLTEVCPTLIGENQKVIQHVNHFTQSNLKRLSNPATTLAQLKDDAEYQMAYEEAKKDSLSADQAEQKQGCEDILSL